MSAPLTERVFTQGSIQATGGNFDAAINGNGFFVVQNPAGATLYSRAGNFNLNAQGNLITATGQFVQGWSATGGVVDTNQPLGKITLPVGLSTDIKNVTNGCDLSAFNAGGCPSTTVIGSVSATLTGIAADQVSGVIYKVAIPGQTP